MGRIDRRDFAWGLRHGVAGAADQCDRHNASAKSVSHETAPSNEARAPELASTPAARGRFITQCLFGQRSDAVGVLCLEENWSFWRKCGSNRPESQYFSGGCNSLGTGNLTGNP